MINTTISHYHILKELGSGGMGVVYLAEDLKLERQVAIKVVSKAADRTRFLSEARLAASLTHPNIAVIHELGEEGGLPFIVMEFVKGQKFSDLLATGELTFGLSLKILAQIVAALAEAHSHKIIHRDIKPGNVIITEQGQAKVLDFGLAKQLQPPVAEDADIYGKTLAAQQTQAGTFVGTWHYASPEQAQGNSQDADERSDVFSLGVILYQCLTNELPFKGDNPLKISGEIQHVEPVPPSQLNPNVSTELERITRKALAKRRDNRYQSAKEMLADLEAVILDLSQSASLSPSASSPQPVNLSLSAGLLASAGLLPSDSRNHQLLPHGMSPERSEPAVSFSRQAQTSSRRRVYGGAMILLLMLGYLALARATQWWPFSPQPYQPFPEAARWYREGLEALHDGVYFLAWQKLDRAVKADKNYLMAQARLAEALAELDNSFDAQRELLQLSNRRSELTKPEQLRLDAITASVARNAGQAVAHYQRIVETSSSPEEKQEAYFDLAHALEKNDQLDLAIASYRKVVGLNPRVAAAHLRLGILYSRKRDGEAAQREFNEAEPLYRGVNVEGQANLAYWRGFMFESLGQFDQARAELQQALESSKLLGNQYMEILTQFQLSGVAADQDKISEAIEGAQNASRLAHEKGMEQLTARGFLNLGYVFFRDSKYAEAEQHFVRARDIARQYKVSYLKNLAELNLGAVHIRQGKKQDGVREIESVLSVLKSNGYPREAAEGIVPLLRAKRDLGELATAQSICNEILVLAERSNDEQLKARAHTETARIFFYQGRYAEAISQFENSKRIYDALPDKRGAAGFALSNLASCYWRLGRYDEAKQALSQVAEILNSLNGGAPRLSHTSQLIAAEIALSQQNSKKVLALTSTLMTGDEQDLATEARLLRCRMSAESGTARAQLSECQQVAIAFESSEDHLLFAEACLMLAQFKMGSGDKQGAIQEAQEAQTIFARMSNQEAEWRAWLMVARGKQQQGDLYGSKVAAQAAQQKLNLLKEQWGEQVFNGYENRPDVRGQINQLRQLSLLLKGN